MKNLAILGALLFGAWYIDKNSKNVKEANVDPDFYLDTDGNVYVRPPRQILDNQPPVVITETQLPPAQSVQLNFSAFTP